MTHRTPWSALPPNVVAAIEAELGAPIVSVHPVSGGASPTLACTVVLGDDTRHFVKAALTDPQDRVGIMLEREVRLVRQLPVTVPTPALEMEIVMACWRVAVFQHIHGQLVDDPARLFDLIDDLRAQLDPLRDLDVRTMRNGVPLQLFWAEHAHLGPTYAKLAELEAQWIDVAEGDALVHFDLHDHNVIIDPSDSAWVIDWANAVIGAPEMEVAGVLPGIAERFAIAPRDIWQASTVTRERDPRDFLPWFLAHAGNVVRQAVVNPNPRIDPKIDKARPWAEILLAWSQELLGDAVRVPTLDEIARALAVNRERTR